MELDHFAPILGQNGKPCAILPPIVCVRSKKYVSYDHYEDPRLFSKSWVY